MRGLHASEAREGAVQAIDVLDDGRDAAAQHGFDGSFQDPQLGWVSNTRGTQRTLRSKTAKRRDSTGLSQTRFVPCWRGLVCLPSHGLLPWIPHATCEIVCRRRTLTSRSTPCSMVWHLPCHADLFSHELHMCMSNAKRKKLNSHSEAGFSRWVRT